jgi:protein-tyrosine phosphatase
MRRFIKPLIFTALTLIVGMTQAWAQTTLILDMRNAPQLPRHFRSTSTDPNAPANGWNNLHIAGGGEFSELALKRIIEKLHIKHFTVIDLRQESHGFLNGNAISWYGPQDAANAGKSSEQIEEEQAKLLEDLGAQENADVYQVLKKSSAGIIEKSKLIEFAVHRVGSEKELVQKYHLRYHRIYVQDFHAPNAIEVDRFIRVVKELPKNEWIYFHCHAGVGRTTTFMVMYDMLRNAKHYSFDAILARQRALGGKDLTVLPASKSFKYQAAGERLAFLKAFYFYTRNNTDNFAISWLDYSAKK